MRYPGNPDTEVVLHISRGFSPVQAGQTAFKPQFVKFDKAVGIPKPHIAVTVGNRRAKREHDIGQAVDIVKPVQASQARRR